MKALEPWLPTTAGLLQAHLEKASAKATCKKGFAQKSQQANHVSLHTNSWALSQPYDKLASTRRKIVFALDFRSMWQAHDYQLCVFCAYKNERSIDSRQPDQVKGPKFQRQDGSM